MSIASCIIRSFRSMELYEITIFCSRNSCGCICAMTSRVGKLCAKVVRYMALHIMAKTSVDNSTRVLTLKIYFRHCKYTQFCELLQFYLNVFSEIMSKKFAKIPMRISTTRTIPISIFVLKNVCSIRLINLWC